MSSNFKIEVYLDPSNRVSCLGQDVIDGLGSYPKKLSPKWFYDENGSQLFEQITTLPEYYQTRAETEILTKHTIDISKLELETLIELGSGNSEKTKLLLDTLSKTKSFIKFVPFDVSEQTLRLSAKAIVEKYQDLEVVGIVGDFENHLDRLEPQGKTLIAFLGGTLGNLLPDQRQIFFQRLYKLLNQKDLILLGVDLVKSIQRLIDAYNDAKGITAEFNLNVLNVLNKELQANFDLSSFEHVAIWNKEQEWIEMRLRSRRDQNVYIKDLDLMVPFFQGEEILTEISAKFTKEKLAQELEPMGFGISNWWTDQNQDFAVLIIEKI